jgi:predicted nuclease of predicted toxin-antitoxin system
MRILLDESLPHRLRAAFPGHEVATVAEVGWSGRQNGELLRLAAARFDLFVTADQNLQYQQNLSSLPLSIGVLAGRDNRLETLLPLAAQLLARLPDLPAHALIRCDD